LAGMVVLGSQAESQAGQQAAVLLPQLGAQLVTQKYSRDAERESDLYGMQYMSAAGYDPRGAVSLQETFVRLAENRRQDWLSGLFASHPPSQERVARNREIAESLPSGGELGRERYQRAIATLKSDQPAYDAYQEAGQALADENTRDARRLVRRAIELEPREPLFHVLAGDIASAEEDQREAYGHYDRAVDLYPDLFYSRMQRGEILYDRGDRAAAQRDLEHSVKLLPTAKAHYLLGNIARDGGRRDDARQHYGVAAQSDSRYGQAARAELQRLGS
ncbi:MAG: M48 family metalloprotease, partial [Xanthomonadales bacterium]|nr:M48 family metalloprotease [Xanthomonadales bacterium]